MASKVSEFQQWATEVKKVNIEALAKWEEKELFAEFMEDYNTGTLPHRKYYDLMAYAQQQAMKAAKKGRTAGVRGHVNIVPSKSFSAHLRDHLRSLSQLPDSAELAHYRVHVYSLGSMLLLPACCCLLTSA